MKLRSLRWRPCDGFRSDRTSDRRSESRAFPCRASRPGKAAPAAAWLARILDDLEASDEPPCSSLFADRTGLARLWRQRQAVRSLRAGRSRSRHVGACCQARHRENRRRRPRRWRRGDDAACQNGAGATVRPVLLRFRLSGHWCPDRCPGPPEGNLVPVIQPARARPSAGRRHTRNLQGLCRALPAPLGFSQGCL
jgi:hypothetical protein